METETKSTMGLYGVWINVQEGDKRLTVSPHSLLNRFSSKSFLMGSRKAHSVLIDIICRLTGEAAIMVSTSTLKLLNYSFIPTTKGRAKTKAARDFLKAIGAAPGWKRRMLWFKKTLSLARSGFYTFSVRVSAPIGLLTLSAVWVTRFPDQVSKAQVP